MIEGGCLCGACRYRTEAAPLNMRVCHCRRCQKATGAPFFARILVPIDGLSINGHLSWMGAHSGLRRGFCADCGTSLFSERLSAGVIGVSAGSLDRPELFRPTEHNWTSCKQPWLMIDDGLAQYAEGLPI